MLELFIINTTSLLRLLYIKALFLKKHLNYNLKEKQWKILFLLGHYNDEINTKTKAFLISLHQK